jgi:hypothetical protein
MWITWTGEYFGTPMRLTSPRLVPKVASPSRSTICIAPARLPVTLKGQPEIETAVSRHQNQDVSRNPAEGRDMPAVSAPMLDDDGLDNTVSGLVVGGQCLLHPVAVPDVASRLDPAL